MPFNEQIRNAEMTLQIFLVKRELDREREDKIVFLSMNFHILSVPRSDGGYQINHSSKCG